MARWSDPLAGLNAFQRRRKEREDAEYIQMHIRMTATPKAIEEARTYLGGVPVAPTHIKPFKPGDHADFIIACRLDLEHPLYFADNEFGECADCGCDLQWRPHAPEGIRLCLSCTARRVAGELAQPSD